MNDEERQEWQKLLEFNEQVRDRCIDILVKYCCEHNRPLLDKQYESEEEVGKELKFSLERIEHFKNELGFPSRSKELNDLCKEKYFERENECLKRFGCDYRIFSGRNGDKLERIEKERSYEIYKETILDGNVYMWHVHSMEIQEGRVSDGSYQFEVDLKYIGRIVKYHRDLSGLSLDEILTGAHITLDMLEKLESGELNEIPFYFYYVCKALDINVDELTYSDFHTKRHKRMREVEEMKKKNVESSA